MEGGSLAYHRNGETIGHGFLGSGLAEAVESDPAALEAAETYHGRMLGGFIAQLVGLGCLVGGVGWALSEESDREQTTILVSALGCALAGSITSSVFLITAQPYHWDAINIYNDNAAPGYDPTGLYPPPHGTPVAPSLRRAPGARPTPAGVAAPPAPAPPAP